MLLHKMKAFAIYPLVANSCLSQEQHRLNQDSLNVLRQLCPYNDFCQNPATQIMDDKTHSPCCRHCSCDKGCEQLQSCCPDNESHIEDLVDTLDKVGIKDCTYPLDDSLPIESILQTNNCYLVLEKPSNMHSLTTKYRCFLPDISQCNETGSWTQFNETISTGCNNFDMPFITELADGTINAVYKNVFCFLCNSPSGNGVFDVCSAGNFRFDMTTVSFIGVIDYNQWLHEKKYRNQCNFDEIFDHVLVSK